MSQHPTPRGLRDHIRALPPLVRGVLAGASGAALFAAFTHAMGDPVRWSALLVIALSCGIPAARQRALPR